MKSDPKLIVALDYEGVDRCLTLVNQLDPNVCRLKVGKQLFTIAGPRFVEQLIAKGFDVFLDLKFHDIPSTVEKAVKAACDLGVWMVNVHASGGGRMMSSAAEAVSLSTHKPWLIGVTVLTSMDESEYARIGYQRTLGDQVLHLAQLTQQSGLDGVVCSAAEATLLRQHLGASFCLVTPGIRPHSKAGSLNDDQSRVVTPAQAIELGSHYIVVGRPITQSKNPSVACQEISQSIQGLSHVTS
ncbi:orotidine-5'-phosphate decarboxylase [bacterium]|nr:orotidine-5'-phosphate decarboxylase [bacterium]